MANSLYFSGKDSWFLLLLVLVLALIFVLWAYRRVPVDRSIGLSCAALKVLGIFLLLVCLLEPMVVREKAKPQANLIAVLVDTGEGMNLADKGKSKNRASMVRDALVSGGAGWQARLEEEFRLKRYSFDSRLNTLASFENLNFAGSASELGKALGTLANQFKSQPLAGVLVFTDGVATDLSADLSSLPELPPVFPVVFGDGHPGRDVSVGKVLATQTVFEDAPVTISAKIQTRGCEGEELLVRLQKLDFNGSLSGAAQEQSRQLTGSESNLSFRFQVRPAGGGTLFYRLSASVSSEQPEATLANNSRLVVVERGESIRRVLYVAGRANWEYKFLKRALSEDDKVSLVGLVRIAKKEPKFAFKGRIGETTNPLFRGFKNEDQDAEDYDKPVLIRLDTRDAEELKAGFPSSREDLFSYDAVIVDDLEVGFFSSGQHSLLREYVNRRGGGLLMLGGQESFRQGKYENTGIGELLPVYLDRMLKVSALTELHFRLTRQGWLQPWMRLRENESGEKERIAGMGAFSSLNRVRGVKPGASVLATVGVKGKAESFPALVAHRFGRGRVAALLLGDFWRWGFSEPDHHKDMAQAWRQLIRWLVADVPSFFELNVDGSSSELGRGITVAVRNKEFRSVHDCRVSLKVRKLGSPDVIHLTASEHEEKEGVYSSGFIERSSGAYLVEAEARDADGLVLGASRTGWETDFLSKEYRSLAPDSELLENLADKTGGRTLEPKELDQFGSMLSHLKMPVTEMVHSPAWHQFPLFLLALVCFVLEWFLRRRKGLP